MDNSTTINIVDLSDEILLTILNKLNNVDVLYSLLGVNKKLDKLAKDITFMRSLDFVEILSDEKTHSMFDRFSIDILPRIQHNIECLTLEPSWIERVLYTVHYPKLHKLTLVNIKLKILSSFLTNESLFIQKFQRNISHLTLIINDDITNVDMMEQLTKIYTRIFILFPNLTHFEFDLEDTCGLSPSPCYHSPSTSCYSSSIVYLRVQLDDLDDCLYLLDGRLNQLHTFIVEVEYMLSLTMIHNKTEPLLHLKCFSLFSRYIDVKVYDSYLVPLLNRMSQLEKLTLSIVVKNRSSFIDGTALYNDVLSNMSQLHTFTFDIVTDNVPINEKVLPSSDCIRETFMRRGYHIDCYIDYCPSEGSRCHIYSLPYTMNRLHSITNSFHGGLFVNVRRLMVYDTVHSFEHNFFVRLSRSFPFLKILSLQNTIKQKKKQSNEDEQISLLITYPYLTDLYFGEVHTDYVEQFLIDSNTCLPYLKKLYIKYETLFIVTKNFTNNETRRTCSKLKEIIFDEGSVVLSKEFYLYFPLL